MRPTPELGDTLLVAGRPAVVVSLLPGRRRHEVDGALRIRSAVRPVRNAAELQRRAPVVAV